MPTSTFCFSDNAFVLMHDRTFDPHNKAGMWPVVSPFDIQENGLKEVKQ